MWLGSSQQLKHVDDIRSCRLPSRSSRRRDLGLSSTAGWHCQCMSQRSAGPATTSFGNHIISSSQWQQKPPVRTVAAAFIPCQLVTVIHCHTVCRTLYCVNCSLCRRPLRDWSLASYFAGFTWTSLHGCPFDSVSSIQTGMSSSPVDVSTGVSLFGRWLLPGVRQHSALSAVRRRSNLLSTTNTRQLRRQNICDRRSSSVEFSACPAAQSRHYLRTV